MVPSHGVVRSRQTLPQSCAHSSRVVIMGAVGTIALVLLHLCGNVYGDVPQSERDELLRFYDSTAVRLHSINPCVWLIL